MGNSFEIHIAADNIEQAKQEIQQRARKALTAVGVQTSSLARTELQRSPSRIDTGLLRNSITYALDGEGTAISSYSADGPSKRMNEDSVWSILQEARPRSGSYSGTTPKEPEGRQAVYIGTGVEYAIYVHEGTDRMAPNRFLKNAVENNQSEIISIIKQELT